MHDPYAFPQVSGRGMSVGINQEAFVSVHTTIRERYLFVNQKRLNLQNDEKRRKTFVI